MLPCMQAVSLEYSASQAGALIERYFSTQRRVMLYGQPGIGKTTLAGELAKRLCALGRPVWGLGADPGSPVFGVPGAICLGYWEQDGWCLQKLEALCSLDAARFRLPLVMAVRCLADSVSTGTLLLDAPGVTRGVAGAELLGALVDAARIDLLLVLLRASQPNSLPLQQELRSLGIEWSGIRAADAACRPSKQRRARHRTALWDRYLQEGQEHAVSWSRLQLLGMPPRPAPEAWLGKQVAFLVQGRTQAMGEVTGADPASLRVRLPAGQATSDCLLVRDAWRDAAGLLSTSRPFADKAVRYLSPSDLLPDAAIQDNGGERPMVHVATALGILVNGVFGDPLLHLRLRHQRRSLLFDLGEGSRLPAQVSDVFISHTHMDHICGFLWLLRSRIGEPAVCRLYGPPGLAANIAGLMAGIHWDRIGERGPRFEVLELHGERLHRYRLQAGHAGYTATGEVRVQDGVLLAEPGFRVRAVTLDHGTPVLAYAYEPARQINVRKERLLERQLAPGPWLNELKQRLLAGETAAGIELPDGRTESVARLAAELTLVREADRLVYATDFADTPENRARLMTLAQGVHSFFCEATFLQRDKEQAIRTGHLTTRACGEIASQARVRYLIPFHFSRRYEDHSRRVYEEIAAFCPNLVWPRRHAV